MPSDKPSSHNLSGSLSPLDRLLSSIHRRLFPRGRVLPVAAAFLLYCNILLFGGDSLKISNNYFVLLPLIAAALCFGLPGGLAAGVLALPSNLLIFFLMGCPEYAPSSLPYAGGTLLLLGCVMGYLSDFFYKMDREIRKRREAEEELRRTLADKEVLLHEINHRVRNNLNVVKGLIQLQMNRVDHSGFQEECRKLSQRIFSLSLVHDQLYRRNEPGSLDLRQYMTVLLENLLSGTGDEAVRLETRWPEERFALSSDRAVHLGLIVHEVVMNAVKYAFGGQEAPLIVFELLPREEGLEIRIGDNGCGFDAEGVEKGLGLRLIEALCGRLDGSFSYEVGEGMLFRLKFPLK